MARLSTPEGTDSHCGKRRGAAIRARFLNCWQRVRLPPRHCLTASAKCRCTRLSETIHKKRCDSWCRGRERHRDRLCFVLSKARGNAGVDAHQSPFYEWLNNAAIWDLVHRGLEVSLGERLVLIQRLIPGLVQTTGSAEFAAFVREVSVRAHHFQEAVEHLGEGRDSRVTPGKQVGGPTPTGHDHLEIARDPDERGAREAERTTDAELWMLTVYARPGNSYG